MLLIAVDGGGCHAFALELGKLSRQYKEGKGMVEVIHNSISIVFKKLKYHKGKMDITITEVEDVEPWAIADKQESAKRGYALERRPEIRLASREGGLQTFDISDQLGDTGVQKEVPRGE